MASKDEGLESEMKSNQELAAFTDRTQAGRLLATRLSERFGADAVVLGLTRGGVPVADEVARALTAALDVVVVSRLGVPWRPETAMGAVAEGGVRVVVDRVVDAALVSPHDLEVVEHNEWIRVGERVDRLRGEQAPLMLGGRTVLIVDDGIVSGASARAACEVARLRGAQHLVVAVPVATEEGLHEVSTVADEVVALRSWRDLAALGQGYVNFNPVDDADVLALLRPAAGAGRDRAGRERAGAADTRAFVLPVGSSTLEGTLAVPEGGARELVIVAHDSCRERFSSRSGYLGRKLTEAGFATLLVDLLTQDEERRGNRFLAIDLLAERLLAVTWEVGTEFDRVDYVADGVAAAVALEAAARPDNPVHAVACLGGRPDLAPRLGAIRAPVLFLVGQQDSVVLSSTNAALNRLRSPHRLSVVPRAGHRFRGPGALQQATEQLCQWLADTSEPGERESQGQLATNADRTGRI